MDENHETKQSDCLRAFKGTQRGYQQAIARHSNSAAHYCTNRPFKFRISEQALQVFWWPYNKLLRIITTTYDNAHSLIIGNTVIYLKTVIFPHAVFL